MSTKKLFKKLSKEVKSVLIDLFSEEESKKLGEMTNFKREIKTRPGNFPLPTDNRREGFVLKEGKIPTLEKVIKINDKKYLGKFEIQKDGSIMSRGYSEQNCNSHKPSFTGLTVEKITKIVGEITFEPAEKASLRKEESGGNLNDFQRKVELESKIKEGIFFRRNLNDF